MKQILIFSAVLLALAGCKNSPAFPSRKTPGTTHTCWTRTSK
ncbi:hypothetical protein ACQ86N_32415 [Puia sp. P3]